MADRRQRGAHQEWRSDFHRVWGGETVSLLGGEVARLALPLVAITTLDATPAQLGLLGAATYLPFLALGIPVGLWVDHVRRRPLLIGADVGQLVAIGAIPVLAACHQLTYALLVLAALTAGAARVVFLIGHRAYLPSVVPQDRLTWANSRLTASESVAEIGGPGLAGVLAQAVGAPFALAVDAASYLASAIGLAAVRQREDRPAPDPAPARAQVAQGFGFTFANPCLRAFAGEAASYNLCWEVVQTVLVLFVVRELSLPPTVLGLALSIGAVGALLGALATPLVARRVGLGRTLVGAAVVGDLAPLALPLLPAGDLASPLLAATFFVRGLGVTGCNVHVTAIRQSVTPNALLGRTNAAYLLLVTGVAPVGALLGGWLGGALGLRATLTIGTAGLLSTAFFLILSPVRRARVLSDCGGTSDP